ncbi:response regulator [Parabacteroides sp. TA-V-105]|jgi:DNA-binding NtrC family response regulator|uniref:sigma-54-dependent transcriptional regulator n=2 Tax=Tannerellaceae TaxID=2005525 RepID=UPI002030ED8A|nr:response regulator [Parabacteroides sp. TA-V-105]MCM0711958.1 response regulator [Parabacteroides sp. TA-V-105]
MGVGRKKNPYIFAFVMRNGKIIVVDDNEAVLKTLRMILSREFKTVVCASVPTLLPALLREDNVDVVLLDMNFGTGKQSGGEGLFWLDRIRERPNPPEVVLITAFGDIELAVSSLKKGAADFIVKPWDNDKLLSTVIAAWESRSGRKQNSSRKESEFLSEETDSVVTLLVNSLLRKYATAYGKPFPGITPDALHKLSDRMLNGDLSLLQQTIERAVLLSNSSVLDSDDFYMDAPLVTVSHPVTLEEMEKQFISEVLAEKKGNLTLCAQQLNISRQTLYNKMKKYNL